MNEHSGTGALALALAKAQAAFPAIPRSREVTVQTKTGGSYKFKYAPLDTILEHVRKPLSDNGLAICQLIDDGALVTLLLHESGATLEGRVTLPNSPGDTVQQLGSAITYLRRYALQAALGIAAEEDDDGNASAGNRVMGDRSEQAQTEGLIGTVKTSGNDDFQLRQTPDGHALPFRLAEGQKSYKVLARGVLAEQLAEYREGILEQRVTCWGTFEDKSFDKTEDGKRKTIRYKVLNLTRLKVGALDLTEPEAPTGDQPDADFDSGWLDKVEAQGLTGDGLSAVGAR